METKDMTTGRPAKLIFFFALPLVMGNVFQQLYTFVDTVILGQKLGVNALAALGAAEWLVFLMFGMIQGVTQGFSVVIAECFGKKDEGSLQKSIFSAIVLSLLGAFLFLVLGQCMLRPLLHLLRTPEEIMGYAHLYLKILYTGIPISFAYNMTAAVLRAFGNSRSPVEAMIVSSFGNIGLDLVLVIVLEYGIAGAAWATVISQIMAFGYCIHKLLKMEQMHFNIGNRKLERTLVRRQIQMGFPMGIQNLITSFGGLVVQSVANGFGILFLAGYTAANKLYALLEIAASSYGYAISTYTAQNMGAGRKDRVGSGLKAALLIGCATAVFMSFIMIFGGKMILHLFLPMDSGANRHGSAHFAAAVSAVNIEGAIAVGHRFLLILAVFFPLLYILYIIRACIQGMGNSVMPMLSSIIQVMMRVMCALFLVRFIGNTGIFFGEIAAWIGADLFLGIFLAASFKKSATSYLK